ncbi:MAG: hypothetical protein MUP22_14710 [Desulfobacterales bacterium]|nr:hypothetical protein [Desulfobacterales bacterium]
MTMKQSFDPQDMKAFEPAEKVGLISTINPEGLVHITLITSMMAPDSTHLALGQFCVGLSKWFMQNNPNVGFLIMSLDRKMWRGKAIWTHKKNNGPEFEFFNELPMFRYNAYFGINTVHYLDLVETSQHQGLPMAKIIPAAILTKVAKGSAKTDEHQRILKPFAEDLFNKLDSLKFISFIGNDGFPKIIPVIQCQAADSRRLVFSPFAYNDELSAIPAGASVTVFCMTLNMQSVLVRGTFTGYSRNKLIKTGVVDIDWVYNSMPPKHEQIYPELELKPVVNF